MKKQYKSYQETVDFLKKMVKEYPNLIRVQSIGKTWEDREIMLATVSLDVEYADLKPALLYTGTIHAREWIGNELAVKFIEYLLHNYKQNPKVSSALIRNTLYIVPCLNPDGFEYSRTHFSFWRKNRRNNKDGTWGVDLNRNFSIGFNKGVSSSSNIYGGPEPFSEPETRAIKNFVDNHNNITIALDYHSQGNVFFPAHKFNHEAEVEGTDLNVLCANMVYEMKKVTGREYGIHRGKPPGSLIGGSGREYYYSRGIIASVVEVGTRNIPDFMQNMSESIDENIPALLHALDEAKNYSKKAPKRVESFNCGSVSTHCTTLSWEYDEESDVYFEIYRNDKNKQSCKEDSLIAVTKAKSYQDVQLQSGKEYYYYIRAYDRINKIKSPFGRKLRIKTLLDRNEFSRVIFPSSEKIGYLGENTQEQNRSHFGINSLFIGISQSKGICYGVMQFSLDSIPENAIIKEAKLSLYPMNRVGVKIEKFGEWTISIIDEESVGDITDFTQIHKAARVQTLGDSIKSEKLTQGIWSNWNFNLTETKLLTKALQKRNILFRIEGPTELPLGRDSQLMQFDIGYGKFGGGIHYRPNLEIKYTVPETEMVLNATKFHTIYKNESIDKKLQSGFDQNGDKVYGYMEFDLSSLPNPEKTIITDAYVLLQNKNIYKSKKDVRYHIEFVDVIDATYEYVKTRDKIELVGYEISQDDLKKNQKHYFIFDTYSKIEIEKLHSENKNISLVINSTISSDTKNSMINWHGLDEENSAKLVIKYIEKRKNPLPKAQNLKATIEKGMVKLSWENPKEQDFVGAYVVRNRFHPPYTPFDGVKLYAGKDNYTYDNFGSTKIDKYYAVFTYDDVPNYSKPEVIEFKAT